MPSSAEPVIDLNVDLGEGPGEQPLYAWISSANIACGGHAGDDATMGEAVRLALSHGVAIGAHPSYPDRSGFGRMTMNVAGAELSRELATQIASIRRVAEELGARVTHVKPHGALYNDAAARPEIAVAVADGVAAVSPALLLVGLAGSTALEIWRRRGFTIAAEGFADRAYAPDRTLLPRSRRGAVITDPQTAAAQAVRLAREGHCDTICVHADTPGSATIAAAVRAGLETAGFTVRSLADR